MALIVLESVLRCRYLWQPMRYDESVTYVHFATRPWLAGFASYRYPNNHILHTALVKACAAIFGNAPWSLRLSAFAPVASRRVRRDALHQERGNVTAKPNAGATSSP